MLETFKAILFSAITLTSINIPNYTYIAKNPYLPTTLTASTLEVINVIHAGKTISEKIIAYSLEYDVNALLALNIACAESNFIETAKNTNSTASGIYQWIDSSWRYYGEKYWGTLTGRDRFNADDNIELAMIVLSKRGTTDWDASKHIWLTRPYERGLCDV